MLAVGAAEAAAPARPRHHRRHRASATGWRTYAADTDRKRRERAVARPAADVTLGLAA